MDTIDTGEGGTIFIWHNRAFALPRDKGGTPGSGVLILANEKNMLHSVEVTLLWPLKLMCVLRITWDVQSTELLLRDILQSVPKEFCVLLLLWHQVCLFFGLLHSLDKLWKGDR